MEGCLTYSREQKFTLTRYDKVFVRWDEATAENTLVEKSKMFQGQTAQVLQHEIDHCEGRTIKMIGKRMI
jgi:peptide deformylase